MKKVPFALVLLLFISFPLWAKVNVSMLSPETQAWYNHNSITIQKSRSSWIPFQGGMELSKVDFLNMTGEYELASQLDAEYKRVRKLNNIGNVITWGGIGLGIAGTIWMLASFDNDDSFLAACLLSSVSVIVASSVGIPLLYIRPKENIPISFAINLADIYNENLFK